MRILAVQLKRIGDLVLTTPALAALKERLPDCHLTLLAPGAAAPLRPAMDYVDRALIVRKSPGDLRSWAAVAGSRFDVCLDFTGTDRSALATYLSGAPLRATFSWAGGKGLRSRAYTRFIDSPVREHHTVDHYLHLLRALDLDLEQRPVALHLPPEAEKKADALDLGSPFTVIHPGTARAEKYWLPERWAEVIAELDRLGHRCVLTGGTDPFERSHLDAIMTSAPSSVRDLGGKLDLLTFAAVAGRARLFLSVDSGPMHIASAFGTPQIALFGPTNPFHWRPRHSHVMVVTGREDETTSPRRAGSAMSEISTEQVIRATHTLLARLNP